MSRVFEITWLFWTSEEARERHEPMGVSLCQVVAENEEGAAREAEARLAEARERHSWGWDVLLDTGAAEVFELGAVVSGQLQFAALRFPEGVLLVNLEGRLDQDSTARLQSALEWLDRHQKTALIFDLHRVSYASSNAVGLLCLLNDSRELRLLPLNEQLQMVMGLLNVMPLFRVSPDAKSAREELVAGQGGTGVQ